MIEFNSVFPYAIDLRDASFRCLGMGREGLNIIKHNSAIYVRETMSAHIKSVECYNSMLPKICEDGVVLNDKYVILQDCGDLIYLVNVDGCVFEADANEKYSLMSKNKIAFLSYKDIIKPDVVNEEARKSVYNRAIKLQAMYLSLIEQSLGTDISRYPKDLGITFIHAIAACLDDLIRDGFSDDAIYYGLQQVFVDADSTVNESINKGSRLNVIVSEDRFSIYIGTTFAIAIFVKPGVNHFSMKEQMKMIAYNTYSYNRLLWLPKTVVNLDLGIKAIYSSTGDTISIIACYIYGSNAIKRVALPVNVTKRDKYPYVCKGFDMSKPVRTAFNFLLDWVYLSNTEGRTYVDSEFRKGLVE